MLCFLEYTHSCETFKGKSKVGQRHGSVIKWKNVLRFKKLITFSKIVTPVSLKESLIRCIIEFRSSLLRIFLFLLSGAWKWKSFTRKSEIYLSEIFNFYFYFFLLTLRASSGAYAAPPVLQAQRSRFSFSAPFALPEPRWFSTFLTFGGKRNTSV